MGNLRKIQQPNSSLVDHVYVNTRRGLVLRERVVPPSPRKRRLSTSPTKSRLSTPTHDDIGGDLQDHNSHPSTPKRARTDQKVILN
jgi:hypothetical protein